ncbi:hypothetical protein [Streptomyces sp. Inha503]|uniref:hypothetical protein n=1 Tax=Streptomyces sp. Inha503 TaxID=3383314 RepID=UPI00399F9BF8
MTSPSQWTTRRSASDDRYRPEPNGHRWQEWDSWQDTGLVAFPVQQGEPKQVRAECQCTWFGPARSLEAGPVAAAAVVKADWETHIAEVTKTMLPLHVRESTDDLLSQIFALIQERPLAALDAIHELQAELDPQITVVVAKARHLGESWQQIAKPLGVSRQSAWEKYQFAGTSADIEAAYAKTEPPTP